MSLLLKLKTDQLQARKDNDVVAKKLLTTLLGEVNAVGKKSNREPTDDEMVKVVGDFRSKALEVLPLLTDLEKIEIYKREIQLLETYFPKQMDEVQLRSAIAIIISSNPPTPGMDARKAAGLIMTQLSTTYKNQYDSKIASAIANECISAM